MVTATQESFEVEHSTASGSISGPKDRVIEGSFDMAHGVAKGYRSFWMEPRTPECFLMITCMVVVVIGGVVVVVMVVVEKVGVLGVVIVGVVVVMMLVVVIVVVVEVVLSLQAYTKF